ncbi:MAG: insulinase family protein [Planctomycetota bacterium]
MKLSTIFTLALAGAAASQPLETRDDLLVGTLDNGLTYMIKEHGNPENRAGLYLHVSAGSLNETDDIRGIAHYLEHMAFNGSANFEPTEVVSFFESMGLSFGRHQNAFTSFDQTTYILNLPDAELDTIDKGLLFFDDVAGGLSLLPEEIDEERGIIQEERRTRLSPQQRVQEQLFEAIAPGSTFGKRLPIGTEETIDSVQRDDFVEFYETYYTASNMTLMVVADRDAASIVPLIEKYFENDEKIDRPADLPVGVTPYTEMRAEVFTDPELTNSQIQIITIREPLPPVTTKQDMRRVLVESLASSVFNRRLQQKINEGELDMLGSAAFVGDFFGAMRASWIQAFGRPDTWRDQMEDLTREFKRAHIHGFSAREIEDARKAAISNAERFAEQEPTLPATAILAGINQQVASGDTVLSAAQRFELTSDMVPTITDDEVNAAFRSLYDDEDLMLAVSIPESVGPPSESELLEMARSDLSVTPEAEIEDERPDSFMASLPTPGTVAEIEKHEPTQIWSAWLNNGVRTHYRFMDKREDNATITITVAGGRISETPETHGLTAAAALAFSPPATQRLSSTNIRDLLTGTKVTVGGRSGGDTLSITVSGNPTDLEAGMQLAHLLLTEPAIEQAAFDRWKETQRQAIEQRKTLPQGRLQELLPELISPEGEVRLLPLSLDRVEAITLSDAQRWLEQTLDRAPIEVAVVGDIEQEAAMDLVARYIGSLPPRERISDATLDELRTIEHPVGPLEASESIETSTPVAIAITGSFGPDASNVRDTRLVRFATQILTTRMIKQIREQEQLVYSISAQAQPSTVHPGMGLIFAVGPTNPGNQARLAAKIDSMFSEFAENGPSSEEVEVARGQIFNTIAEDTEQPGWWTRQLSDATYRGKSMEDLDNIEDAYSGFTADDIREAFARYYTEDNKMSVVVGPKSADGE